VENAESQSAAGTATCSLDAHPATGAIAGGGLKETRPAVAILSEGATGARGDRMDRDLIIRAQGGDQAAFEHIAAASLPRLWTIARRVTDDHDVAEDAVQDCLVRAWRDLRALRDPDRFEAWLYRLLVHACRDRLKADRRRPVAVLESVPEPVDRSDPIGAIEARDQLERGFDRLSVDHRAALVLHHLVGLRVREIARILGIPEGTVESRLHYATRALRTELEADRRLVSAPTIGGERR
jgi:RNA polymerase sigma-70 factor (ECF subfamily)